MQNSLTYKGSCITKLQAMAAYRTAARLFPGLHLPLLGMGCEYARMNNTPLAEQLLLSAHRMCPQVYSQSASTAMHCCCGSSATASNGLGVQFNMLRDPAAAAMQQEHKRKPQGVV